MSKLKAEIDSILAELRKLNLQKLNPKNLDLQKLKALDRKQKIFYASVAGLVLVVIAALAGPQLLKKGAAPAQPLQIAAPVVDDATFEKGTRVFHITPFNDAQLEFEIRLPSDWELEKSSLESNPELSKRIIGDIARLRSPLIGTQRAYAVVQALQLNHEIEAQYWLKNFILSNSYIIQGDVVGEGLTRAKGQYTQIENNSLNLVHAVVQFNGDQAILARIIIPNDLKGILGVLQEKSIDSFKLAFLTDNTIEKQKVFTLADAVKFTYPASWDISAPDFRDMNRLTVQLLNRNSAKSIDGFIRCVAIRRRPGTSFREELELLKAYLADMMKLKITGLTSSQDQALSDRFVFSRLEEYTSETIDNPQAKQEIKLLAMGGKEWYLFFFLVTPTADTDLYNWARNTRSFTLMRASIK